MDSTEKLFNLTWQEALDDLRTVIKYFDEQSDGCYPACLEMACFLIKEKIGGIKHEA